MYIRLHNSCTYLVFANYFEIRSDVYSCCFRIKGIKYQQSHCLLNHLQNGIRINDYVKKLTNESQLDPDKINNIINFLLEKKLIIKSKSRANKATQNTLYDRQIRFFDSFENTYCNGKDFNDKLQNRKIVIVGLGGYGSWLALHCARLGIKHIVGIDFDTVELSNLPRQVLYTQQDIGHYKNNACRQLITAVDAKIKYESHNLKINCAEDLIPLLKNTDLVFNAFGYYSEDEAKDSISDFINNACIKTKTAMLCLSTTWLGPFYIPNQSACYFCTANNPQIKPVLIRNKRNARVDKRALGPLLAMTCSLAVYEAVQYLSAIKQPSTVGGIYALDPFQINNSQYIPVKKNNNCRYCQELNHA